MSEDNLNKIKEDCQELQKSVVNVTKSVNQIPVNDFTFYNSFDAFSKVMQHEKKIVNQLISKITKPHMTNRKPFDKIKELDDKFDLICDFNDLLFDKVNNLLDDAAGIKKKDEQLVIATLEVAKNTQTITNQSMMTASWNKNIVKKQDGVYNLVTSKMIQRPQVKFKDSIDNRSLPFVPIIKEKPNSLRPLAIYIEVNELGEESFCHPYEFEIEKLKIDEQLLKPVDPIKPKSFEETPFKYIDTKQELIKLCEKLKNYKEIAIDLEHHSYRSFQGFTCLMQISTRDEDFIVDTLELRSEMFILNEVFTDPKILKVFHGADMDIVWLQKDFGIYVVNMFDTGQAAKLLKFAHFSLSYLFKRYCSIEMNKQYQLADWRMRPIPQEMLNYARGDTHYLLYIYDLMRNDLHAQGNENANLLRVTHEKSNLVTLKKYEKPLFTDTGFLSVLQKSKSALNKKQIFAAKEIYAWRDKISRLEDESTGYVLPNHMLLTIATVLPREQQGILACCNPIPPLVKQQLNELHKIVYKARELQIEKISTKVNENSTNRIERRQIDLDNVLNSSHDILYSNNEANFNENLNTLLDNGKGDEIDYDSNLNVNNKQKIKSLINIFVPVIKDKSKYEEIKSLFSSFISPFERYKKAIESRDKDQPVEETKPNTVEGENDDESKTEDVKISDKSVEIIEVDKDIELLDKPLKELMPGTSKKRKKKQKQQPDIPCNPIASAQYKIQNDLVNKEKESNVSKMVESFDYKSFDFNRFTSKKNKFNSFDPDADLRDGREKRKRGPKRKPDRSYGFDPSKKSKN